MGQCDGLLVRDRLWLFSFVFIARQQWGSQCCHLVARPFCCISSPVTQPWLLLLTPCASNQSFNFPLVSQHFHPHPWTNFIHVYIYLFSFICSASVIVYSLIPTIVKNCHILSPICCICIFHYTPVLCDVASFSCTMCFHFSVGFFTAKGECPNTESIMDLQTSILDLSNSSLISFASISWYLHHICRLCIWLSLVWLTICCM